MEKTIALFRRRVPGLTLLTGAVLLSCFTLLWLTLLNEYQIANQKAQTEVETFCRVLEGHASATVAKVDLLLRETQREIRPADMRPGRSAASLRGKYLHELLESQLVTVPEVAFIHISDAAGNHIYSSMDPVPRINIADRYHFQRQRDDAAAGLVISPPLISRTVGKWTLVLTRRLNFEDGSFAGVVNVVLNLESIQQFYRSLDLGKQGLIALYDAQQRLVARHPASEKDMGKISNLNAKVYIDQGLSHASYHVKSPLDGVERMYSFRQVGSLPLFVFAAKADDDYLAEWRRHIFQYSGGAVIFCLMALGFGIRQQRADEALRKSSLYARSLIEASLDPLVTINPAGKITDVNEATESVTGHSRAELIGSDFSSYFTDPEKAQRGYQTVFSEGQVKDYPLAIRHVSGAITEVLYNASLYRDEGGKVAGIFAAARDITERKKMEDEIRRLAFYDPLTKLANRRMLHEHLKLAMAAGKRSNRYGALMLLDLDNFKPLNDKHGHDAGDLLLIEVANRIKSSVREVDTVARFGGDEFVVLLGELSKDKTASIAEADTAARKIHDILSQPYVFQVQHEGLAETTVEHRCTATIGLVLFLGHESTQEDILKWADMAMYQAKESGRNSIRFYDAGH